jgi:uncharacterized membrane protein
VILALASALATNLAFLFEHRGAVLTHATPGPLLGLLSPWTLTAMLAGAIAFYASARSLQVGEGVEVIALTSVAANLAAIIGGVLVCTVDPQFAVWAPARRAGTFHRWPATSIGNAVAAGADPSHTSGEPWPLLRADLFDG